MPDVVVIATAKARPGKEKELERVLREVAKPTRAQAGSVEFTLYRSEAPGRISFRKSVLIILEAVRSVLACSR